MGYGYKGVKRKIKEKTKPFTDEGFLLSIVAEREGFEPSEPCGSPLFESGQFNHSCTSPLKAIVAAFNAD